METRISEAACPAEFEYSLQCGPAGAWAYSRPSSRYALETASWKGFAAPDGRPHFHDEAQLVFVICGRREFIVRFGRYVVNAGQCLLIPAGHLHRSIPCGEAPTQCFNVYVSEAQVVSLCESFAIRPTAQAPGRGMSDVVRRSVMTLSDPTTQSRDVSALAAAVGYSREGFSRKFAREAGIGAAEFSLLVRLNRARALLRSGNPAALTALECGFADQSHMGRHFLRTFGTSPVRYVRG